MKRIGLFVETPLQLLCAYEAISACEPGSKVYLYLRLSGRGNNDKQLIDSADSLGMDYELLRFEVTAPFYIKVYRWLFFVKFLLVRFDRVYIGSYFSGFFRLLLRCFRSAEVFYLDDGMATLLAHKNVEMTGEAVSFFTFFDISSGQNQKIIKHQFGSLRARMVRPKKAGRFFVGQPLLDYGYIEKDVYIGCIKDAAAKCQAEPLIYIPHRYETQEFLREIEGIAGIEILRLSEPVELFFLNNDIYPAVLWSFSSTVLVTVNVIFPECALVSYRVEYENYPSPQHLENVYQAFSLNSGIEIVDVRPSSQNVGAG